MKITDKTTMKFTLKKSKANYKIYWESNSRAKGLFVAGKIKDTDIIKKCKTAEFPKNAMTVRMHRLSDKYPYIVLHVKGDGQTKQSSWGTGTNQQTYTYCTANTLRVSFGGSKWDNVGNARKTNVKDEHITFNGMLDGSGPPLQDIVDAVAEVKEKMGI
jgi:hypothetical protein